jgi:trehalose-phosphatase
MRVIHTEVNLGDFFDKLSKGTSLLMLDYDGTLSAFCIDRMKANPYPGVTDRLESLVELKKTKVVIISGRSLSDLDKLLKIPLDVEVWGSHGLEGRLSSGQRIYAEVDSRVKEGLEEGKERLKGVIATSHCEFKPYAVAIHWRGNSATEELRIKRFVADQWQNLCLNFGLEIHPFDGGLELRPQGRNKGDIVKMLLQKAPANTVVAYLGDDTTDEDAFAVLGERGLKVLVREEARPTRADISLSPPQELLDFFDRWISALKAG